MLAPFRVRSFRFQWPADLLTSWGIEMENLVLGWYILVETGSVLALTLFWALQYLGTLLAPVVRHGGRPDRAPHRDLRDARRLRARRVGGDGARLGGQPRSDLRVRGGGIVGADPALRPRHAQRADRRDDAARDTDGDDGRLAHDRRLGAHRRVAVRRRAVRRVRHGARLCCNHRVLRARLPVDAGRGRAPAEYRARGKQPPVAVARPRRRARLCLG